MCGINNFTNIQVPRDGRENADPYVKLYLLPDHSKETKRKTTVAKRTLSPTYNETVSQPYLKWSA